MKSPRALILAAWLFGVLLAGGLMGSAPTVGGLEPLPTWPVPPERLPEAVSASGDIHVTCGGRMFPAAGLDAPIGAEMANGPEFDALREALTKFGAAFTGSMNWGWRLAGLDTSGAIFLAKTDARAAGLGFGRSRSERQRLEAAEHEPM